MDNMRVALVKYAHDTENPETNYQLGLLYEAIGQTASAITYFLRSAERTTVKEHAYECLIKVALCFEKQGNRSHTVLVVLRHAACLLPKRPEAHFFIARTHERAGKNVEGYTAATLGLVIADLDSPPLRTPVTYPGKYGLLFQKAVSAWWWGRTHEARKLFTEISEEYLGQLDTTHYEAVKNNIINLGTGPDPVSFKMYDASMHPWLKFKFPGSDTIKNNHSQVMQDLFTLACHKGKRNGTFLEVGGYRPYRGNNTAVLEEQFGWNGATIEIKKEFADEYAQLRRTKVLCADALTVDYEKLLADIAPSGVCDYLQLDVEPSNITFEVLVSIPFDKFKFGVITYEHDHYLDMTKSYRKKSRNYLKAMGYELVIGNVSPSDIAPFEDWWVHPDLIDRDIIDAIKNTDSAVVEITKHMLSESTT
jgi:hypothetical protein